MELPNKNNQLQMGKVVAITLTYKFVVDKNNLSSSAPLITYLLKLLLTITKGMLDYFYRSSELFMQLSLRITKITFKVHGTKRSHKRVLVIHFWRLLVHTFLSVASQRGMPRTLKSDFCSSESQLQKVSNDQQVSF